MYHIDTQMVEPTPFRRPINWAKLRTDEAERLIRERAEDTARVIISFHAFDRVEERSFTHQDIYKILRTGSVEGPAQKNLDGEWEVVVVKRMPGTREAGAITIIYRNEDTLFVKTVEWMDLER